MAGYGASTAAADMSYQLQHKASPSGALVTDISQASDPGDWGSNEYMPSDVYAHPERYFMMDDVGAAESWNKILELKGKPPDTVITIYRGAPKDELNTGDWVSLSREFAERYAGDGAYSDNPASKVSAYQVKASELVWQGDDIREFGYFGKYRSFEKPNIVPFKEKISEKGVSLSEEVKNARDASIALVQGNQEKGAVPQAR